MSYEQNEATQKLYFPLLDIGRFLAAFSVLCFHYFSTTARGLEQGFVKVFLENGFFGVQLFFMISGFVIFFSLGASVKKFALSRFLRIYPLFWLCCSVTYLVTIFFGEKHLSLPLYVYNLFIINTGKTAYMIDGSYWTLTHELLFYVYIATFVSLFGKRYLPYFFYGWLSIISLAVFLNTYTHFIYKVLLVRSGYYFIFGGLVALLYSEWATSSITKKITSSMMILFCAFMPLYLSRELAMSQQILTNHFGIYSQTQEIIVVTLHIFFVALVLLSPVLKKKKARGLCLILGGITYPLYLLHQVIGATILGKTGDYGYVTSKTLVFVILILMASYGISVYEKRVRQFLFVRASKIFSL